MNRYKRSKDKDGMFRSEDRIRGRSRKDVNSLVDNKRSKCKDERKSIYRYS